MILLPLDVDFVEWMSNSYYFGYLIVVGVFFLLCLEMYWNCNG